ncbi:MAG TPA: hypothetical protein VII76_16540 [Acidimicrobiales bacterium]
MSLPDGAIQVFSEVTRISPLTASGSVAVGANVFVTDQLIKATLTPSLETGVDLAQVNANGDLIAFYKHGDMPKYYTCAIEVASPDPVLHQILAGGTVLAATGAALTAIGTVTGTPGSAGTLAAATYSYKVSAATQFGEGIASAAGTATTTGSTGSVALSVTAVASAVYYRWYGRTAGAWFLLAQTLTPAYTDTGAAVPNTSYAPHAADSTAGPGSDVGYQFAPLGIPGNHNGVSLEFWGQAIVDGAQTGNYPYEWWVVPAVKDVHEEARTFGPTILENMYTGIVHENANWGAGPFGDWPSDSSKVAQYIRVADTTLPVVGLAPILATA